MINVHHQTMHMMRNVTVLTQSLPKVPERHTISMRVLYRDDRTPVTDNPLTYSPWKRNDPVLLSSFLVGL